MKDSQNIKKETQEIRINHLEFEGKKIDIPHGIILKYTPIQLDMRSMLMFPKGYGMLIQNTPDISEVKRMACNKITEAIFKSPAPDDHLGHLLKRDFAGLEHYWQEID